VTPANSPALTGSAAASQEQQNNQIKPQVLGRESTRRIPPSPVIGSAEFDTIHLSLRPAWPVPAAPSRNANPAPRGHSRSPTTPHATGEQCGLTEQLPHSHACGPNCSATPARVAKTPKPADYNLFHNRGGPCCDQAVSTGHRIPSPTGATRRAAEFQRGRARAGTAPGHVCPPNEPPF
jgi:hypothetical protein